MKTHLLLSAVAAALLVSGTAMAANATPAKQCTALISQWNDAAKIHKYNAKFGVAEKDALAGEKMCHAKNDADGIKELTKALNTLGVKPAS